MSDDILVQNGCAVNGLLGTGNVILHMVGSEPEGAAGSDEWEDTGVDTTAVPTVAGKSALLSTLTACCTVPLSS